MCLKFVFFNLRKGCEGPELKRIPSQNFTSLWEVALVLVDFQLQLNQLSKKKVSLRGKLYLHRS